MGNLAFKKSLSCLPDDELDEYLKQVGTKVSRGENTGADLLRIRAEQRRIRIAYGELDGAIIEKNLELAALNDNASGAADCQTIENIEYVRGIIQQEVTDLVRIQDNNALRQAKLVRCEGNINLKSGNIHADFNLPT